MLTFATSNLINLPNITSFVILNFLLMTDLKDVFETEMRLIYLWTRMSSVGEMKRRTSTFVNTVWCNFTSMSDLIHLFNFGKTDISQNSMAKSFNFLKAKFLKQDALLRMLINALTQSLMNFIHAIMKIVKLVKFAKPVF